jgi:hypothetical protein
MTAPVSFTSVNTVHRDERKVGDIDMIKCVRDILVRHGLKQKVEQLFDTDVNIVYAANLGHNSKFLMSFIPMNS